MITFKLARSAPRLAATLACSSALVVLPAAPPAFAHHSFAMFDMDQKVRIEGVVAEVQWTNPHVWVEVDVPGEDGEVARWGVEFTSRVHLIRRGFDRDMLHPGDAVVFELSPYRDGQPGGRFWTVTNQETGETYRDPGAQRAYLASLQESGETPPAPSADEDEENGSVRFYRYGGQGSNAAEVSYAALDNLPDWRGVWQPMFGRVGGDEPQLKGAYRETYEAMLAASAADPSYEFPEGHSNCDALGMPAMMTMPYSLEFLFTPGKITVNQEAQMQVRRIYTDGRALPENPDPTYFGYSVGHWEDDTLVVETVGTKPGQRLGVRGITNGPDLKITERIYLDPENEDVLHLDFTFEDPDALAAPWTRTHTFRRNRDWDMLEYVCDENDRHPMRAGDGQTVAVLNDD